VDQHHSNNSSFAKEKKLDLSGIKANKAEQELKEKEETLLKELE